MLFLGELENCRATAKASIFTKSKESSPPDCLVYFSTASPLDNKLRGVGKAVSRGRVLFVRSSTTSSSRRQCDGGGRSGLFSDSDSFYQLCQLSALPASILGLSEQTKTGATRGRGRQSRRKPMPQAVLAGEAHPIY